MKKALLLLGLFLLATPSYAAFTFGNFVRSASFTSDQETPTITLTEDGTDSILIVVLIVQADYSGVTVEYNGNAMTSLGGKINYTGTQTMRREVFWITDQTSGNTLDIDSTGETTTLGSGGGMSWRYEFFTYGGVDGTTPIGETSINATNFTTSNSGSPVTTSFSFNPDVSNSRIVQIMQIQGSTCAINYNGDNGTDRKEMECGTMGGTQNCVGLSDYEPGSGSPYTLGQTWTPNFCSNTGYGWGIELLSAVPPTPTNTPTITPTPIPTVVEALFVVGSTPLTAADQIINDAMVALAIGVEVVEDQDAVAGDATGKKFLWISSTCNATTLGTTFRTVAVNLGSHEPFQYDDLDMTGSGAGDRGTNGSETQVDIEIPSDFLADGNPSGLVTVSTTSTFSFGVPNGNGVLVVSEAGFADGSIFYYESGATMFNSLAAPARRLGFFFNDTTASTANAAGLGLLDRAIEWLAGLDPAVMPFQVILID